ncbi:MAG: SDR family NAD(P)-dependent oxidoreductase [Phycisphaera sp.]|nr:SDR family NAD(P)-dependent oxidoreductase [Phycisphaera sp.]
MNGSTHMLGNDRFDLRGRGALVNGSSRGIGRAIALALAHHGARVWVHAVHHEAAARDGVREIEASGGHGGVVLADLASRDGVDRLADHALAPPGVDILVLNASVQEKHPWQTFPLEEFDREMAVNVRASFQLIQRLTPAMIQRRWGRILAIGSVNQFTPSTRHITVTDQRVRCSRMKANFMAAPWQRTPPLFLKSHAPSAAVRSHDAAAGSRPATPRRPRKPRPRKPRPRKPRPR